MPTTLTTPMASPCTTVAITGSYYAFISENSGDGLIGQFELTEVDGQIGGSLVRTWKTDDGQERT